jgi:hypothetical protein
VEPSFEPRKLTSVEDTLSWVDEAVGHSGAFLREAIIYRGQSTDWPLLPSILRLKEIAFHYHGFEELENAVFEIFKSFSYPYLGSNKPASEFEWMTLAQHHGCWTRLLDWTWNPLVALFFATERDEQHEADEAVVWCYRDFDWYDEESYEKIPKPVIRHLNLDTRVQAHLPKHISPRIAAQAGCFTRHSPGHYIWEIQSKLNNVVLLRFKHMKEEIEYFTEQHCSSVVASLPPNSEDPYFDRLPLDEKLKFISKTGSLSKAVIPPDRKKFIRRQLDKLNINRASLFPGLDGISDYIKQTLNRSIGKD